MRQRLSSEPDRYRGRRRVPTPPRSRYAAVVTTAFVGAGVVALGAGSMPDAKTVSPSVLADLETASITADDVAARAADADRASRDNQRAGATESLPESATGAWRLPLENYEFTAPFAMRWGKLHAGIDLSAPEGTEYRAVHAGVVKKAGWAGGFGYAVVLDHGDGTQSIYAHSSALAVRAGQRVKAGDVLGRVGNTGYSYGRHLHLEIHDRGVPKDPIPFLAARGVDIKLELDQAYGAS